MTTERELTEEDKASLLSWRSADDALVLTTINAVSNYISECLALGGTPAFACRPALELFAQKTVPSIVSELLEKRGVPKVEFVKVETQS